MAYEQLNKSTYSNKDGSDKTTQTAETQVGAWDWNQITSKTNEVLAFIKQGYDLSKANATKSYGIIDGAWAEVTGGAIPVVCSQDADNLFTNQCFVDTDGDGVADDVRAVRATATINTYDEVAGNAQKIVQDDSGTMGVFIIDINGGSSLVKTKSYTISFSYRGNSTNGNMRIFSSGGDATGTILDDQLPNSASFISYSKTFTNNDNATLNIYPSTSPDTDEGNWFEIANLKIKEV